jgi:AcrR family transcriptional regulator
MARGSGLDRAAVVAAAAAIADAEGLEALTLGALAERLGIRAPSLYNHVAGLAGLRRELTLLGLQQMTARLGTAIMGKSGAQAVMALAEAYRAYVTEHPGVYATTLRATAPDDQALQQVSQRLIELVLAALSAYALHDDDAIHAVRGLRSLVHGFASLEAAGGFGMPLDRDESFRRLIATFVAGLEQTSDEGQV